MWEFTEPENDSIFSRRLAAVDRRALKPDFLPWRDENETRFLRNRRNSWTLRKSRSCCGEHCTSKPRTVCLKSTPDRPSLPGLASVFVTAHPVKRVRNTSPCAYRRSRLIPSIERSDEHRHRRSVDLLILALAVSRHSSLAANLMAVRYGAPENRPMPGSYATKNVVAVCKQAITKVVRHSVASSG